MRCAMRGRGAKGYQVRSRGNLRGVAAVSLAVATTIACGSSDPLPTAVADATPTVATAPAPRPSVALPAPPPPPIMSEAERAAIREARDRVKSVDGKDGLPGVLPKAPGDAPAPAPVALAPTSLTAAERRAARDDPAARLDLAALAAARADEADVAEPPATEPADEPADEPTKDEPAPPVPAAPEAGEAIRKGVTLFSSSPPLRLTDLAIGTSVKSRVPQEVSDSYATMPDQFVCFSVFDNRQDGAQVTHVWRRDGRVVSRVELEVGRSSKWRTWSRQRVKDTWTGHWSCEVLGPESRMLGRAKFAAGVD